MNSRFYDKLYSIEVENLELLNGDVKKSFIFQGNKNWDLYFFKKPNIDCFEIYSNVKLSSFDLDEKKEFEKYLEKKLVDYSTEHIYENGINKFYTMEANA